NVLMDVAAVQQLQELSQCSYAPLADAMRDVLPRERRHMELGLEGLERIATTADGQRRAKDGIAYWYPRVAETFGAAGSERFERQARVGLRHTPNEDMQAAWQNEADAQLVRLKLTCTTTRCPVAFAADGRHYDESGANNAIQQLCPRPMDYRPGRQDGQ